MLLGEIVYKVGQKHRLALPKKFRQELGEKLVMTRGFEGCLVIVSGGQWQQLMSEVDEGSFLDVRARESARFLFGGASEIGLDSQGRFIVPDALYQHANLSDEVVFVGLGRWVEVWDRNNWNGQVERLAKDGAQMAQRLTTKTYRENEG